MKICQECGRENKSAFCVYCYNVRYKKKHPELHTAYNKKWYAEHPGYFNKRVSSYSPEERKVKDYANNHDFKERLIIKFGSCQSCGSKNKLEVHHKKYTFKIEDCELLCRLCHIQKHGKRLFVVKGGKG